MANVILKEKYQCLDDCEMSGCPGHEATLEFQTTSNAYAFHNGKGNKYYFEENELQTMVNLLKRLSERRADSLNI